MPWWGWLILAVVAVIAVPIKLRILKSMIAKRQNKNEEEDVEDF